MSDSVWIVLIIAVVVLVALFIFRRQLSSFFLKASKEGLEAKLETREPAARTSSAEPTGETGGRASVNISGSRQVGRRNKMRVGRPDVNISDVDQFGTDQEIEVEPDPTPKKRKKR